jgi:hypothetical protein
MQPIIRWAKIVGACALRVVAMSQIADGEELKNLNR